MRKKTKLTVLVVLVITVVFTGVYFWKKEEQVPEYVFTYAENQASDYPTTLGGQYFAKLVEERTDGRIRILVQHSGERGAETEVVQQLTYGGVDFARLSLAVLTEYINELSVLQLPYLYRDSEHMWKVLDGEIGDSFLSVVSESELIGLSWYDAGARNFYTTEKPIACLEDIDGMTIRVQESNMMADVITCLGGTALKEGYAQVYSLLERGKVQGAENNWASYESAAHYEVAKYYTVDEHTRVPEIQICSRHTWEKLTEEEQEIILECAKESAIYQRALWEEQETKAKETAIAAGTEVIELSDEEKEKFRGAVLPVYEKYCGQYLELVEKIIDYGN